MMTCKNFGRGFHVLMLVEEPANVLRERPVFGLTSRIQRNRRLLIGMAYRPPAPFAFGDKRWKLGLAPRDGDSLFVRAPVGVRHHATYPARQTCAKFNTTASRPAGRGFGGDPTPAQFAGEPLTKAVELDRPGIEAFAIQPLGLHRQVDMRARRIGMERHDVIVIVAEFGVGQRADGSQHFVGFGAFGH